MIFADYGEGFFREVDETTLERRDGIVDNDNEHTEWIEYWDGDKCVHRSAHVQLKR